MTDTREALRRALTDQTATADLSPSFAARVGDAAARHARRRRRTAQVVAVTIVAVLATGAFVGLRSTGDDAPTHVVAGPDRTPVNTWVPIPDGPLSPRDSALAFTVGDEVLFLGGRSEPGCPAGADCVAPQGGPLTDAAAYDPATRTWRSIADPPAQLLSASGAVTGDRLYLWADVVCPFNAFCTPVTRDFLIYDIGDDQWRRGDIARGLPLDDFHLVADGDRLIGYRSEADGGAADFAYDPVNDTWAPLPLDPLQPGFDRVIVPHDGDLYLFSVPNRASRPSADDPGYYQAAVLEAGATAWRTLPSSTLPGFAATWASFGDLVVNPLPPAPPGSGRSFPPGEAFDTVTEQWSVLPEAPAATGPYYELGIVPGTRYVASYGFVLDPLAGTWSDLPVPPDAADQGAAAAWVGDTLVVWGGTRDGATIDTGATWTVSGERGDDPDQKPEKADAASSILTPEMEAALAAGDPVVINDEGNGYCAQRPNSGGYSCGSLGDPEPSISMGWDHREGAGSIIVVDGQRRLGRLEVVDAAGEALRTVRAEGDGLYLRASASQVPDTIRVVARDGTVLRTLYPAAMAADNLDAVASSGSAAD